MDFLPSSITSAGRSENFVFRTNSTTYFVGPGVCGNGAGTQGEFSLAPSAAGDKPTVVTTAPRLAEDRKKSRLFMAAKYPLSSERLRDCYRCRSSVADGAPGAPARPGKSPVPPPV